MNPSRDIAAQWSERACKEHDAHAALALLDRSIALKHRRIALIRYLHAQYLGAPLEARHHDYVKAIAARLSMEALTQIAATARARFDA
ncbi:hypothetical protein [Caballeronia cordobensis]|uniref:Uncharacterized protein n=1 Tax=Caballeronia cordobensis TaxID=1353886 RepID=A0A158ISV1_CABCO|nr:hypothetical protein [Caballeronia cordobensis]AET91882.1 hypothetical protein BYI23_B012750 [Burkholderia sp. YI23]AQH01827.1 hypothetical protein A9R05_23945 [Burkholderia sp. KK1]BAO89570.1 putative uncharacterized protein [Burkholderia sp. RPE67]SAL59170.1 hypothetical protein AWB70_05313 [Caballeronia cordobensis]